MCIYFCLNMIFLGKAGTSLQSVAAFHTEVQLGQHVYVHSCCGHQQKRRFQETRQVPPAVGVAEMLLLAFTCCRLFSCSAHVYFAPHKQQLFQEKGIVQN